MSPPRYRAGVGSGSSRGELPAAEMEVARLVAEGLTNAAIARRLSKEANTVRNQTASALRRLGLQSRTQLAMWVTERDAAELAKQADEDREAHARERFHRRSGELGPHPHQREGDNRG